jgi:hypothetical protein
MLILDNDLAIDQRRSAAQLSAGVGHTLILVAPVQAAAGEGAGIFAGYAAQRLPVGSADSTGISGAKNAGNCKACEACPLR